MTTPEDHFRSEARAWLADHVPGERPRDSAEAAAFDIAWQRTQFEHGWAGISWPAEYGGRGLSLLEQLIWHEEYARAGAPYLGINYVGLNHAGPTLIALGTDEQKCAHLAGILSGEQMWCQGFSEPGAGSDLASLRTKGEIIGDEIVVNGQKIWTSYGQFARYQELLVRTDPAEPRHKGISWVICDMHAPGIDVRPIQAITGEPEFCEVFYDNVRLPLSSVVGGVNAGWRTAMATLAFERGTGFIPFQIRLARTIDEMILWHHQRPRRGLFDGMAERLAILSAEVAAMRAMTYAVVAQAERTGTPGEESAIIALYFGELAQRVQATAHELIADDGLVRDRSPWPQDYLDSFKETIGGGTSEIRRNIVAERMLGLPR